MKKRTIRTFAAASFFNDMGSDIIAPLWPVFIKETLGAPFKVVGILDGFRESITSISQVFSGYLSDRLKKRKVFIWTGYLCGALARVGYAVSTHWGMLFPAIFVDRVGKMRDAPRDAMVADISTRENRARNFGTIEVWDNTGAVVGILLSIWLVTFLDLKTIFLIAAIPTLISVLLVILFIHDTPDGKLFKGLAWRNLGTNFNLFTLSNIFFTLGFFSYSFLLLFLKDQQFSLTSIPVYYLIFSLSASIFSGISGRFADKFSRRLTLIIAFVVWAVVTIGFLAIPALSWTSAGVLFVLYGVHKGALKPAQSAFVSESAPVEQRASILGFFKMITGLCALPASFIAGVLWDAYGPLAPFSFALAMTLIALFLLLMVKEPRAS